MGNCKTAHINVGQSSNSCNTCGCNPCGCNSHYYGHGHHDNKPHGSAVNVIQRDTIVNLNCHTSPIGYLDHHACTTISHNGCNSSVNYASGCSCGCCSNDDIKSATCLNSSLICIETVSGVNTATINSGISGTVLALFDGKFYQLSAGDVVTLVSGVLTVNGTAASSAAIFTDAISLEHNCCTCPTLSVNNVNASFYYVGA